MVAILRNSVRKVRSLVATAQRRCFVYLLPGLIVGILVVGCSGGGGGGSSNAPAESQDTSLAAKSARTSWIRSTPAGQSAPAT